MSNLNPDQQRAADYTHERPAVVTAAAGSGKTTLLVCLLYTSDAADER